MYTGDGQHYFSLGIAAVRLIDDALEAVQAGPPEAVLDMPCGFGRVTRCLAARFPAAKVTACDIRPQAVRFCTRGFNAEGVISKQEFDGLSFPRPFDLIWCGSLVTHLDEPQTIALLELFARSVRAGGVIVVTTHGDAVARAISAGADYMLTREAVGSLTRSYEDSGYGYARYRWDSSYGVSVISPDWIRRHVEVRSGLREIYFVERGWDSHQDVFGFIKE
jgi:SAM-dependent methyltransferase